MKRAVRQRCGFGCVMCGSPVFDYEHIDGYANTGHDPDRITLLCTDHHREKTAGRLPVPLVERHNASPFNSGRTFTKGHHLYYEPNKPLELRLGSVSFVPGDASHSVGISVDGAFALGVGITKDGHPVIDLDIRDLDNRCLFRVIGGQFRAATTNWDVSFVGTRLTVRRAFRQIALSIRLDAPAGVVDVERGEFATNHVRFRIGASAPLGGFEAPDMEIELAGIAYEGGGFAFGVTDPGRAQFHARHPRRAYGAPAVRLGSAFSAARLGDLL